MSELSARIYQTFGASQHRPDDAELDHLKEIFHGLSPFSEDEKAGLQSYDEAFDVRFVYHSNSIEGSTLTLGETELVLEGEFIAGYPAIAVKFDVKEQYLKGLENWQIYDDPGLFLSIVENCLKSELDAKISCIKDTRGGLPSE